MLLSEVRIAIFDRVRTATGLFPVIYEGESDGSYVSGRKPYIKISIVPLEKQQRVYCDKPLSSGFILANVYAPDGHGANEPTQQAEIIAALFPEELEFDGIRIPDADNIKGALKSERKGWFYMSALIYFEVKQ